MSIYNDKNYIDNVINLNLIKKQSKMTKNEYKLLSIQGIAKASAFCLLLSAFSVNAAMAAPAPAGTVDEVMAVQQGKKVTGVVVDGTGEPVIGANVVVKGTTNGTITDFDGNDMALRMWIPEFSWISVMAWSISLIFCRLSRVPREHLEKLSALSTIRKRIALER